MSQKAFPHIAKSAKFAPTAVFIGDVYIKDNCVIEENVTIDGRESRTVIQNGSTIGEGTVIKGTEDRTEIGENAKIGKNCKISISVPDGKILEDNSEWK